MGTGKQSRRKRIAAKKKGYKRVRWWVWEKGDAHVAAAGGDSGAAEELTLVPPCLCAVLLLTPPPLPPVLGAVTGLQHETTSERPRPDPG